MNKFSQLGALLIIIFYSLNANAGFGSTVAVGNVKASRIFVGINTTRVTFSDGTLPGCSGNGGYVSSTWYEESAEHANRFISVFLFAKAQNLSLEVRYRVNDAAGGWSSCTIDNIYLH